MNLSTNIPIIHAYKFPQLLRRSLSEPLRPEPLNSGPCHTSHKTPSEETRLHTHAVQYPQVPHARVPAGPPSLAEPFPHPRQVPWHHAPHPQSRPGVPLQTI